jgi:16S rRNA (cytidine1402-2'-O)-methyltransferase
VAGTLFVVATPIGNLEDITYRAVKVLKDADLIACEDTRHSRHLLDHFGIQKPLVSYHDHNEQQRSDELIRKLAEGAQVALISDAGTPLISDPGYRLVAGAVDAGVRVVPVPGASAALAALSVSGLPTDSFFFGGFLPAKSGQRRRELQMLVGLEATVVFYEAPHRIIETLEDLEALAADRPLVLARELTKIHEEFLRGTPREVKTMLQAKAGSIKGEMTVVLGKGSGLRADSEVPVNEAVDELVRGGMARMDAIKQVARERGLGKREVYALTEQKR